MIYKPRGPVSSMFARGGDVITTKSRFLKTQDRFRTGATQPNFDKVGKGGTMSKLQGETKVEKAIKPKT